MIAESEFRDWANEQAGKHPEAAALLTKLQQMVAGETKEVHVFTEEGFHYKFIPFSDQDALWAMIESIRECGHTYCYCPCDLGVFVPFRSPWLPGMVRL